MILLLKGTILSTTVLCLIQQHCSQYMSTEANLAFQACLFLIGYGDIMTLYTNAPLWIENKQWQAHLIVLWN